ncbi:uncharacterized protein LOC134209517 [Armigeres subalbatus]|uniref:uncharacterized protein LOC134209517 n=1 Tax=Armigeres subalbatus TaxID=124917 RepID=UPI002ED0DD94
MYGAILENRGPRVSFRLVGEKRPVRSCFDPPLTDDGRYIVELPKQPNFDAMIRRFELLERRFAKDFKLKEDNDKFMMEYLSLGHMKLVPETMVAIECFLPHHPVIKESSSTTKTRVVFDGSSKSTTGFSLNHGLQALCVGPTVQDELLDLVVRNRKFPMAMTADIVKMYRQVLVNPNDTPLQKIKY